MPIYEYHCTDCHTTFDRLRPMSQANAPASCAQCGSNATSRAISLFSAISKSKSGETRAVSGAGSDCASCAATSCATCTH
jgi:putative FmdB family regulatory protein